MQPIIRQNAISLELPDLRNLGTILRIVLAVNAMTAVAALVSAPQLDLWTAQWLDMTAVVEPHLIAELAVLYALAPWLGRQSSTTGALVVAVITVGIGLGVHMLVARHVPQPPFAVLRHLLIALCAYATLLAYFGLRAKALSPAIAESRLQALQARIRPHFLFNSLNAVLSLIRSDPRQAETALLDMADLFRVLMRDNRELVPLADEIELCRQYLGLEKLRLSDRLSVEWHLNNMPGDALVPPLMLQPLLENAVYHGIEPMDKGGTIRVTGRREGSTAVLTIENPISPKLVARRPGHQIGLDNVRQRLALMFHGETDLEVVEGPERFIVTLRFPIGKPVA